MSWLGEFSIYNHQGGRTIIRDISAKGSGDDVDIGRTLHRCYQWSDLDKMESCAVLPRTAEPRRLASKTRF